MELPAVLSVEEASERLRRCPQAVRLMAVSGEIDGVKRGNAWWLDSRAVERRRRAPPARGRPLSPEMAWSVLLLASGGDSVGKPHHGSRARRWLSEHALADAFPRLRSRAIREEFDAHRSEVARIIDRSDVMATGISTADDLGLHGAAAAAEFYAPASAREAVIDEHALEVGPGPVLARWVPNNLWPAVAGPRAPSAAALVDLLEHDDPRVRREAALALARP
jgi:hypothetical protein